MLDLNTLDLAEIADALADQNDYEHRWLINPDSGDILLWTSETGIDGQNPVDLDELEGLVCIDPLPSYVWYRDMVDFAEEIPDERAGRRLARALQGRGAFRRFKDELHDEYPHLLAAWYTFRDVRAQRRAVEWLLDNSLIDETAAMRFLSEHPDPDLPDVSTAPSRDRDTTISVATIGRTAGDEEDAVAGGSANHFEISGKGVTGVIDTAGMAGRSVVSIEVDGHQVQNPEVAVTSLGLEVSATVSAAPDAHAVYLRVVLPAVNAPDGPVAFSGFAILATALTSFGGPKLVGGQRHLYELRPLVGTASAVQT
jgi:hypothetical protein